VSSVNTGELGRSITLETLEDEWHNVCNILDSTNNLIKSFKGISYMITCVLEQTGYGIPCEWERAFTLSFIGSLQMGSTGGSCRMLFTCGWQYGLQHHLGGVQKYGMLSFIHSRITDLVSVMSHVPRWCVYTLKFEMCHTTWLILQCGNTLVCMYPLTNFHKILLPRSWQRFCPRSNSSRAPLNTLI
jgi:hypothetical protein